MISRAKPQVVITRASFKAWASCHDLALIEVWRGLRDDYTWALKSHFVPEIAKDLGGMGSFFKRAWDCFYIFGRMSLFFFCIFWQPLWEEILLLGWDLCFF